LRSFLGKFHFTGDDVYKKVGDLSGGEKGRLALAKLIYSRVNVLVLDEPTNHLDIPSREALEEALDAYEGTIITISHDRYFLDRVATQILALDGSGNVEHYDGDYTQYHDWKLGRGAVSEQSSTAAVAERMVEIAPAAITENDGGETKTASGGKKAGSKSAAKEKPRGVKVIKKRGTETRSPDLVEAEIGTAEKQLSDLSEQMGRPEITRDAERYRKLCDDYQQTDARLNALYQEWDQLATKQ
jgi:ATP-binding cassette subfamily F protein 3